MLKNHVLRSTLPILLSAAIMSGPKAPLTASSFQTATFDVNDMSYLWPAPASAADVNQLITAELTVANGSRRVWPDQVFTLLLQTAQETSVEGPVRTSTIDFEQFKDDFLKPATWKLVGFRMDPTAPGGHAKFVSRFGSTPQLRLAFQPVTIVNGEVRVHDVAAHLAYSFVTPTPGAAPNSPAVPNKVAVLQILNELKTLKSASEAGGASTSGLLGVHPGLQAKVSGFTEKVRSFLRGAVTRGELTDLAFMGIQPPEPWIFFAMRRRPDGAFVKVATEMFAIGGTAVLPVPKTANLDEAGVSTSVLFSPTAGAALLTPAIPGSARPLLQDIPDIIANPHQSHVLNTDCVSCHTESTRRRALAIPDGDGRFRYVRPAGVSGVDPARLPTQTWNLRNFGWFQSGGRVFPTITQRTANETADATDFANRSYFGQQPAANPLPAAIPQDTRTAPMNTPVASPLTLVMTIKDGDFPKLKKKLDDMQSLPVDQNPIIKALNKLGTVHFARFVFLGEKQLAVITTYDGTFEDYIDGFVNTIGPVFDSILENIIDAPPTSVRKPENRKAFLEFVRKNDLKAIPPFYSSYPDLRVLDILTLQKKGGN